MQTVITTIFGLALCQAALASSHREAPAISQTPDADITDVYVFPSPEKKDHVVLIMNVSPAAQSYAGPNWYRFGDQTLYELHIDTTGDASEDVTYQFRFSTDNYRGKEGAIIANFPSITFDEKSGRYTGSLNQIYSVQKVVGKRRSWTRRELIGQRLPVAPTRIGPHTTDGGAENAESAKEMYAAYRDLASKAVIQTGGYRLFAGPRNDPFFVDLGAVFDRVSPRIPGVTGDPVDALRGSNVLSIVIEVPTADFLPKGQTHFGVWATTSRPQIELRLGTGQQDLFGGGWVQVSRLGNPLVNEVVIKMQDKDKFNASLPINDAKNFAQYVTSPQLASVLNLLYSGDKGLTAPNFITPIQDKDRSDLVAAFVTGLPGINKHPKATATGGDMIRVNLAFGIQEWPLSGRQLKDDVVKSSLVFLAQCTKLMGNTGTPANPFGKVAPPASGITPANCLLDDFVSKGDMTPGNDTGSEVLPNFPYMDLPFSSYGQRFAQ